MPIHVVKSGETIYSIAQLYDVSADRIVYDNELAAQQSVSVESDLFVRGAEFGHFL